MTNNPPVWFDVETDPPPVGQPLVGWLKRNSGKYEKHMFVRTITHNKSSVIVIGGHFEWDMGKVEKWAYAPDDPE